jgi:4-hydroxy-3-polyprenylbenzoate decarboxylase
LSDKPKYVVAVTGASGAIYAVRLLQRLAPLCERVDIILSEHAPGVYATEIGSTLAKPYTSEQYLGANYPSVRFLNRKDYYTPPASGSYRHDGMVVVPCSMGTLGRIASGVSDDLITRAADVCLKEGRKLLLVPRETPLSLIHLRNMVSVTEAGAIILPAMPSFYSHPQTIDAAVDTVIARVMQTLGLSQDIVGQWQSE